MSDLLKILIFSLLLSFLWVIPRFGLIVQLILGHVWQSITIGVIIIILFLVGNWFKSRRAHKTPSEQLNIEKSQG